MYESGAELEGEAFGESASLEPFSDPSIVRLVRHRAARRFRGRHGSQNVTRSAVRPRRPRFVRHSSGRSCSAIREHAPEQGLEGDLALDPRERGAEAEVGRPPEGDVAVVLAGEVEPVGIREPFGVAVGRAHDRDHRLALADHAVAEDRRPRGAIRAVCWLGASKRSSSSTRRRRQRPGRPGGARAPRGGAAAPGARCR